MTSLEVIPTERSSGTSLETMLAIAERISATSFVPAAYRGKPNETLAAILYGREVGIEPMHALKDINVIDGTPSMSPELMRALVRGAGHRIETTESTNTRCVLTGTRTDGTTEVSTFTIEDAAKAGLCRIVEGRAQARSQQGKPKPWETYTKAMLLARATSQLCRSLFADVISGISYTPEELISIQEQSTVPAPTDPNVQAARSQQSELIKACGGDVDRDGAKARAIALWGDNDRLVPLPEEEFQELLVQAAVPADNPFDGAFIDPEVGEHNDAN